MHVSKQGSQAAPNAVPYCLVGSDELDQMLCPESYKLQHTAAA